MLFVQYEVMSISLAVMLFVQYEHYVNKYGSNVV